MARTFNDIISGDKPVVVDFHATWCGPCKVMSPVLAQFKEKVGDKATVIKIDVDKNPQLSARYQISGVPTILVFRKGKVTWRRSGVVSADVLLQAVSQ